MKKKVIVVLCIVMTVGLTGCGNIKELKIFGGNKTPVSLIFDKENEEEPEELKDISDEASETFSEENGKGLTILYRGFMNLRKKMVNRYHGVRGSFYNE